jgi:hypothetical protein
MMPRVRIESVAGTKFDAVRLRKRVTALARCHDGEDVFEWQCPKCFLLVHAEIGCSCHCGSVFAVIREKAPRRTVKEAATEWLSSRAMSRWMKKLGKDQGAWVVR